MTKLVLILLISGLLSSKASAQLTLQQAVENALKNYPSVQVSQAQIDSAAAGIQLARTAYLPRVDTLAQINLATRNNVFGLLLPQSVIPSVIPSMSGPVIGTNNTGSAWGSALGALVAWEPFDFGLRQANVDTAAATRTQSEATLKRTQFEVAVTTADAYLTLAAAQETIRAAQAGVDRAEALSRTITARVNAELRPGADASRAEAELAAARTQLIQAEQAAEVSRATVAQFVGGEPAQIAITAAGLLQLPPEPVNQTLDTTANPIAREQAAVIEQARAELRALGRSYFPRFDLEASVYARGTGAETNGALLGGVNGLAPTVQNYALGFTVTFPVMDKQSIRAKEAAQSAAIRAQTARAAQIATDLRAHWNVAVANLNGARRVAANTPVQVSAARAATAAGHGALSDSGLGNIDEVAEAQRLAHAGGDRRRAGASRRVARACSAWPPPRETFSRSSTEASR